MILFCVVMIVLLRLFYLCAEICFERDWPRSTWKGLLTAFALLGLCASAFGQAIRVDLPIQTSGPSVPITGGALPQALWVANATVILCSHVTPYSSQSYANCAATLITTYKDSAESATCASATPLVQLPGNTCTANTGVTANIGFWYAGGEFDYYITSAYGTYGPYTGGETGCSTLGCTYTGPVYVNGSFEVGPSSIASSGVVGITLPVNATTFPGLGPGFSFHSLSTSGLIFNADGFSGCYPTDNDACAYADIDAEAQLNGATNFNHYISGQFRGIYNGTGGISSGSTPRWDGIDIALVATATSAGAIPTIAGIHIFPPNIMAGSTVTLGSVYGLLIDNMQTVIPFGGAPTAIFTGTGLVQFGDSTYMPRLLQGFSGTAPDLVDVYALLTNTGIGMTVYPPNVLDVDMQSGNMIALHPSSNNTADYTDIKATFSSSTSVSNTLSFNIATVTAGTTSNSLTLRGDGSVLLGNSNLMLVNAPGNFYAPSGAFSTTALGTDAVDIGTSAASSSFPQLVFRGYNSAAGDPRIVINTNGSSYIGIGDDSAGGINLGFTAGPASGWGTIGMNIAITSGDVTMGTIKWFHAAPTISSGFGASAAINSSDGPTSFTMSTGSGSWGSSGVIGLPSAANDWSCTCTINNNAVNSTINRCMQTNDSSTSATITNFNSSGTATAWNANVYLLISCFPH